MDFHGFGKQEISLEGKDEDPVTYPVPTVSRTGPLQYTLSNVSYALCSTQREAWGVPSKTLNEARGQGKAQNNFLPTAPSGTCEFLAQGAQHLKESGGNTLRLPRQSCSRGAQAVLGVMGLML